MPLVARPASFNTYDGVAPTTVEDMQAEHWITRGANFVIVTSRVKAGTILTRNAQPDEYVVVLPEGMSATFHAAGETTEVGEDTLTIVPPGDSGITVAQSGYIYRMFSSLAEDLIAQASNAVDYADGAPDVAPLEPWPIPPDGFKLRTYFLPDHLQDGTNMRLFRCTNLMVNVYRKQAVPREVTKMTPHHHDDFEQGSLTTFGRWVHHMRYPWSTDLSAWREDEHGSVMSPGVTIIPPKVIHTSQSVSDGPYQIVDVFAPPRVDFSLKPGLVRNADEYPLPPRLVGAAPVPVA